MITPEQIARHEAGHAAMAVHLGIPVRYVGLNCTGGYVEYAPHSHTRQGSVRRMMIVLAGIIETVESGDELPEWPIDPDVGAPEMRADREILALLAHGLALTEDEYGQILVAALKLGAGSEYQRLIAAVTGVLDYVPAVDASLLAQLQTITESNR